MKHMCRKQVLCALLAGMLLLSSCGGGEAQTGTETDTSDTAETTLDTAQETESVLAGPDLPEKTWEDTDFSIYVWELSKSVFVAEEQNGDVLNDAKFELIARLEETFLVDVSEFRATGDSKGTGIANDILAGDDSYSLLSGHARSMFSYPDSQLAYDWYTLPYIDFDNEWWYSRMLESMTIGGKIYVVPDDLTESSLYDTKCLLINKDLFREHGIDLPYEAALDGTWTFDMLAEISEQFASDLNGDGTMDAATDLFGFSSSIYGAPMNILWTAGQRIADFTGEGGRLEYVLNNEITVDVYDKFFSFTEQDCCIITTDTQTLYAAFRDGRVAMRGAGMGDIYAERDMDYDIGVMPYPKFYAEQENYCTGVDAGCNGLVIPITIADPEMVSAVVEYWAYLYYRDVLPVFYDTVCKTKAARDEETAMILDLVRDSRIYDIGYFFGSLPMNSVGSDLCKDPHFASYYAKNEARGQAALDEINAYYFGE